MSKKFFWIDLEMTGLDEQTDHILEVAIMITNENFETLDTYDQVVFQPQEVLDNMNDWCKNQHGKSGLTKAVAQGKELHLVEQEVLELIHKHFKPEERVVLCGNSVGNDKRFIDYHMKKMASRLHYRIIDVSSFKEVFRDKYNIQYKKNNDHRALGDIESSISELKTYLQYVQVPAV